ncbi:MAG: hypothetical protein ACKVUS_09520 [Saprospiraceae bacterium]
MKHPPLKSTKFFLEQDANSGQQPLLAYVVDGQGQLLEKQAIHAKGGFEIPNAEHLHHGTRLFIAPELPDNPKPTLQNLLDIQAYEPLIPKRLGKDGFKKLLPVPELLWPFWLWCFCRVRGRVVREFCFPWFFNFCFQLPVCPARVHVCRVKPRIIWALEASVVLKIRDRLLAVPKVKIPFPEPEPLPFGQAVLPQIANPPSDGHQHRSAAMAVANAPRMAKHVSDAREVSSSDVISQGLALKLQTTDTNLLRRALDEHFYEIKQYIPYFDICSWLYRCEDLMTIEVDHDGRFDRTFLYPCNEDNDLYFWVEYLIAGSWVTVYRPGLCSGTFWNYACGTEVVLKVTDSRVTGCRPITGRFMEVNRIGTHAWLPLVDNSTGLVHGLDFGDSTTNAAGDPILATEYERPFAGTLSILGGFGSNLPDPAQATHFRVSLKRTSDLDAPANWTVLQDPLYRGYRDEIEIGGVTKPYDKQFLLNEPGQPEFYKIPKNEATDQTEIGTPPAPATLIDREWATTEFALANIDTTALATARVFPPSEEGVDTYDIKIELCKTVAGVLQPVAVRRELFQIPDPANPISENILADDAHLYLAPAVTDALGMRIRVRIDRRMTTCSIDDAMVDGVAADPQCGLLNYAAGSTARLGFRAAHPDNKATFGFSVVRGNGQLVFDGTFDPVTLMPNSNTNTSGKVDAPSAQNGYNRLVDNFAKSDFSVANMLTVPVPAPATPVHCAGAAFAETLHVRAMATNGSYRLWDFDSNAVAAFAIIEDCNCAD